jgi:hypothetical protein
MTSILRKFCSEQTMLMSLCGAIRERYRGFPTDLGEKATFERLAANYHLQGSFSIPVYDVGNRI